MAKHKQNKDILPAAIAGAIHRFRGREDVVLALGLDISYSTGYAAAWFRPSRLEGASAPIELDRLDQLIYGRLDLEPDRIGETRAVSLVKMRRFILEMAPDVVFAENPLHGVGAPKGKHPAAIGAAINQAARNGEFHGALRGSILAAAEAAPIVRAAGLQVDDMGIPVFGYGVGEIKRRATGKGNVDKAAVIAACNQLLGISLKTEGYESEGHDDIADAVFVLICGLEQYGSAIRRAPHRAPDPLYLAPRAARLIEEMPIDIFDPAWTVRVVRFLEELRDLSPSGEYEDE